MTITEYGAERTKSRPLPSGRASLRGAIALFAILSLPTMYLLSYANSTTFVDSLVLRCTFSDIHNRAILALLGIFPIQGLYPLMKRWTYWPQAWLGRSLTCVKIAALTLLSCARTQLQLGSSSRLGCCYRGLPPASRLGSGRRRHLARVSQLLFLSSRLSNRPQIRQLDDILRHHLCLPGPRG